MSAHLPVAAVNSYLKSRKRASKKQSQPLNIFKLFQELSKSGHKINSLLFEEFRNLG
jgi:hypothetical protein